MSLISLPSPRTLEGSTSLTTFKVESNGTQIDGVLQIQIEKALNSIPKAYILLSDGDVANQSFERSNQDYAAPGQPIKISVGYNSDEDVLFEGEVVKQKVKVGVNGLTRTELVCKDPCYKMTLNKRSRYYSNVTEEDILNTITGDYSGISGQYDTLSLSAVSQTRYGSLVQHNISDWNYLITRLEQSSSFVIVDNGTLEVTGLPVYTVGEFGLEFGRDVIRMDLEVNSEHQHSSIAAKSWDETTQEIVTANSSAPQLPDQGNISSEELGGETNSTFEIVHSGNVPSRQLEQWANAKHLRAELSRIRGIISFQGSSRARLNSYIAVGGISDRFNGPCLITGINHEIRSGDWITTVQIGLDPLSHADHHQETEVVEDLSTGAISGFYTGIVKQVHDDPEDNRRILVNIPAIGGPDEGTWMRLASLDASEKKGFVNRPDRGDEVVVGFLNNDVNQGVVLGALYSKKFPGSTLLEPVEDNNKKGWVIKENMHLTFDSKDDIVELTTAKGNIILINEEVIQIKDQFDNEILMDSDKIELKSEGNISINATRDIELKAANINIEANMGMNAKGSTAKVEASGTTTIKGSVVQIN